MPRAKTPLQERQTYTAFLLFVGELRAKVKRVHGRKIPEDQLRRICRLLEEHNKPAFPIKGNLYGSWSERLENWNKVHPEESITRWNQAIERDCAYRRGVLKTFNYAERYYRSKKSKSAKSKAKNVGGRLDPQKVAQAWFSERDRRALEKEQLRQKKEREEREHRAEVWRRLGAN